jgi:hypothetical protein
MSSFDNLSQNVFGLVALIVSLVALVTTVLQVLQQYYSSAEGYRRCAASVMGLVCNRLPSGPLDVSRRLLYPHCNQTSQEWTQLLLREFHSNP